MELSDTQIYLDWSPTIHSPVVVEWFETATNVPDIVLALYRYLYIYSYSRGWWRSPSLPVVLIILWHCSAVLPFLSLHSLLLGSLLFIYSLDPSPSLNFICKSLQSFFFFFFIQTGIMIVSVSALVLATVAGSYAAPLLEARNVTALDQQAFEEAQQRDDTATRAFSSIPIKVYYY
jgi:hypothetical protein